MLLGDDEVEDNNYNPYAGVYKRAVELLENDEYQEGFIKMFSVVENDGKIIWLIIILAIVISMGMGLK